MMDSARLLDNFEDCSFGASFDKMLIPNRIFKYLDSLRSVNASPIISKHFDKCLYVVNTIYRRYQIAFNIAKKCHWSIDLSKWAVPIYSRIYNDILGTDYTRIIHYLIDVGVIGRDSSYMKGSEGVKGRCKHYWFTTGFLRYTYEYLMSKYLEESGEVKHRVGGVRTVRVKDKFLFKHLSEHAADVKREQLSVPLINELYSDLKHFRFDETKSEQVLDSLIEKKVIPEERKDEEMSKVRTFNSFDVNPYALYCKRDAYGRVHTNITQIKKEVRKNCLLCDGNPTVAIDIKSSQGAFLYTVLHSCTEYILYLNKEHIVNMYSIDTSLFDSEYFDRDLLTAELCEFKRLLDTGSLYEFFMHRLMSRYGFHDIDRSISKKEFLACLFCGKYFSAKKHRLVSSIQDIWTKEFPSLYRIILLIKKNNHAALAHDLQRTESHLVFDIVYNRVKKEIGCHLCTVHDSIVVESKYGDMVKKIFDEELVSLKVPTFTELEKMETTIEHSFERK